MFNWLEIFIVSRYLRKSRPELNFHQRKEERKEYYFRFVYGWKQCVCTACNGSGYYDNSRNGKTPKCSACDGTGVDKYRSYKSYEINNEEMTKFQKERIDFFEEMKLAKRHR